MRAVALLEELVREDETDHGVLAHLALVGVIQSEILSVLGRAEEAAENLRTLSPRLVQMVELDPANVENRYQVTNVDLELGQAEASLGNTRAARAAWQRVVDVAAPVRETTDQL